MTTLVLDPTSPAAVREWQDVCAMHARVVDMTAGMPDSGPRTLWAQPAPWTLVVRAAQPVTEARLPRGWACRIGHRPWTPPGYGRHRAVMLVNPTRQRSEPTPTGGRRTIRWAITGRAEQDAWLRACLDPVMDIRYLRVCDERVRTGMHRTGNRVTHRMITVEVQGIVTDAPTLAGIVTKGFGRARSYGGGLSIWDRT